MRNKIYVLLTVLMLSALPCAKVTLDLKPNRVAQGNSFALNVKSSQPITSANITFEANRYRLYKISTGNYQLILGTTYLSEPVTHNIQVKLFAGHQLLLAQTLKLRVLPKKFRISTLVIAPEKKEETNWSTLSDENIILGRAFRQKTDKKYFSGKMTRPCTQNICSEYGVQRLYKMSGKIISRWGHRGLDFAAGPGTPVKAAYSGRILVAKSLTVHGNTIVIDHGLGIISDYNHLSKLFVQVGDLVKKGELIGLSGQSGLVTGPHLHFGLSVNNVRVNPEEWLAREF